MDRSRLFLASCLTLVATAMVFSIRGDIASALGNHFIITKQQIGMVGSMAFLGFAVSILFGSPLCDALGMGKLMAGACLFHLVGIVMTLLAPNYPVLLVASLITGLGNGLVEAVVNPLIATLYPNEKTHKLNVLHAWWPGGMIVAGLMMYAMTKMGFGWQAKMATVLVVVVAYGLLFIGQKFPPTERVAAGRPAREMFAEALRPAFLLWLGCMLLTASTELGPMQWLPDVLRQTLRMDEGILVFVYIQVIMFAMRFFAGPLAHRLSPVGLLWFSAALSSVGLFMLSYAGTVLAAFAAATIFAIGVCYFWPTMLGVTSERFPRGGALLLGMMGTAGNISILVFIPLMGQMYDHYTLDAMAPAYAAQIRTADGKLNQEAMTQLTAADAPAEAKEAAAKALAHGAAMSFRWAALLPASLVLIFGAIWLKDKASGGYRAEQLTTLTAPESKDLPIAEETLGSPTAVE